VSETGPGPLFWWAIHAGDLAGDLDRTYSAGDVTLFAGRPELLRRFRAGERAALEEVYWAYVGRVEAVARHGFAGVPGVGQQNLADLVQQCFVRAFSERTRLSFDGLHDYAPFIASIARHTVADWWRAQGRLLPLGEEIAERAAEEGDGSSRHPEDDYADAETVRVVEAYLATLDPALRGVHEQLYVQGRPQREAAEVLGLSRQALRTLDKRLRQGLEAALSGLGEKR